MMSGQRGSQREPSLIESGRQTVLVSVVDVISPVYLVKINTHSHSDRGQQVERILRSRLAHALRGESLGAGLTFAHGSMPSATSTTTIFSQLPLPSSVPRRQNLLCDLTMSRTYDATVRRLGQH